MRTTVDDVLGIETPEGLSRRQLLQGIGAVLAHAALTMDARASNSSAETAAQGATASPGREHIDVKMNPNVAYGQTTLPLGIRSRFVDNNNGLHGAPSRSWVRRTKRGLASFCFTASPNSAYSWRKQLLPLASAGFHVVAQICEAMGAVPEPMSPSTMTLRRTRF